LIHEPASQRDPALADENRQPMSERTQKIAQRLTRIRQQKAISQREFCAKLEVSQPMMSHYERGERRIPSDLLADMAEILGVTTDELIGLRAPKKNTPEMDAETKKLWKKFQKMSQLPEHDQRAVIRLINSLSRAKVSA